MSQPEPSPFMESELNALALEIDTTRERIMNSHNRSQYLDVMPCFPKAALLHSSDIVNFCRKGKKEAYDYLLSFYDLEGEHGLHRKQCQYVLSLWVYGCYGDRIPDSIISFVQSAARKEPDDCVYLIKLEHLW